MNKRIVKTTWKVLSRGVVSYAVLCCPISGGAFRKIGRKSDNENGYVARKKRATDRQVLLEKGD